MAQWAIPVGGVAPGPARRFPVGIHQIQANGGAWGIVGVEGQTPANRTTVVNATSYVSADTTNRGSVKPDAGGDSGLLLGVGEDGAVPTTFIPRLGG